MVIFSGLEPNSCMGAHYDEFALEAISRYKYCDV